MINGSLNHSETFDDLYEAFVSCHETQLKLLGISENKWKTLFLKLNNSVFDAGDDFIYCQDGDSESDEEENEIPTHNELKVFTKCSMEPEDEDHVYLIDHAWTYTLENARYALQENRNLVERMCSIMNILFSEDTINDIIEDVLKEMWKYNNSYILQNVNQNTFTRCWFIMDEFGSRIKHSENPTFSVVPFFFAGDKMMYSLLFPVVNVSENEEVTCGYPRFHSSLSEEMQKALKYPWEPCDLTGFDFNPSEPNNEYFMSGRHIEVLPDSSQEIPSLVDERKIKVYSDYPEVSEHLTNPRFYFIDNKTEAHILWLAERLYDYRQLADLRDSLFYISQFPSEQVLINKELLAIVCRRSSEGSNIDVLTLRCRPKWLPVTYSLMIELPQFISYFQSREKRNLDNTWICKPFNLSRGLDIYITDDLTQIVRLNECRPMVACKYITDPVLFPKENVGLVKIDLRFIVLLRSIQNLELFVYEKFLLRSANKPFSMDDFQDHEKHFTVMNYGDFPLQQISCHDFIKQFEDFYADFKWSDIEDSIHKMIKEIFLAASKKEPPAGIGNYPGSRAMYGMDIMLAWDRNHDEPHIYPVLLEVNWMPDCKKTCQYYPEFYDDIFNVLFLNNTEGKHVVQL